jgi:hypothetical protein
MIVQGNDRILFIKRGDNFQPVGCLTSNGLDEATEFLPTTTRNAEGWETQRPTTQNYSINFSGFQVPTSFRANTDFVNFYTLEITLLENVPFLLRFRVEGDAGWFVFVQKKITDDPEEVENNPAGFVLLGDTIADTVQNILENILTYNPNTNVTYTRDGDTLVLTFANSGNYEVTIFSAFADGSGEVVASYELIVVTESNPNPLISYDRLRMMKRNRELITWRIMSSSPVPQYIDEGQGYIANISDVSEVNVDASFSGSIIGYGVPLFIINDAALATGENFVEDGNDNLIEV